ncbi:hypothetical protein [Paenibacillus jilunlii]|uniref:Uncharacterized protein n=1 Tax=Paenibacillus jilunlii TaxID=682956 RepID=A0A1G9S6U6_9BACL|nr:hypothetical protein [Paenibacillus jilunlii]SDM30485.1 hypothetical protein SAMN05216191_11155 [Paenibacillus jilunlii]
MKKFRYGTTEEAQEFCEGIMIEMIKLFNISEEEAWGRVNDFWKSPFKEDYDISYHETFNYWANTIYFGKEARWWKRESDPTLMPVPYLYQN